jgi:hypothetical protein
MVACPDSQLPCSDSCELRVVRTLSTGVERVHSIQGFVQLRMRGGCLCHECLVKAGRAWRRFGASNASSLVALPRVPADE